MALRVTSVLALVAFALTAVGCSGGSPSGTSAIPQAAQQRTTQAITPHASTNPTQNIPVTSAATSPNGFSGTFSISKFVRQNGGLFAMGRLSGTLTNSATGATQTVNHMARMPVTAATVDPSCTILTLTLGPLHLDLLGLVVDLNQVVLTITAQQGPGNLLGNLLCGIANLLSGGSPLTSITNLLNQILAILNGL